MNRRNFTKAISMVAAAPVIPEPFNNGNEMIVHHVFFWLKSPADAAKLLEGLKTLRAIPHVIQLLIGQPASTEKREVVDNSYHVSELMYFKSLAAQKEYQDHPVHQKFIADYGMLWERVVVYDTKMESVS
jgi:hypothetical protein